MFFNEEYSPGQSKRARDKGRSCTGFKEKLGTILQLIVKYDKVSCFHKTQHLHVVRKFSHRAVAAISQPDNGNNEQALQIKKLRAQMVIQVHLHNWAMNTSATGMHPF